MNTKKGNAMMIALIVVAVAAVGIIGYMIYNNNQQQAAADAQLAAQQAQTQAAQQEAQQAQAQQVAQEAAVNTAVDTAQTEAVSAQATAQANAAAGAAATCEENLAKAQKDLPNLEDYAELLEKGGELIEDNPDEAIEQCRITHEGLSKGECETKVDNFVAGKEDLYAETEAEIETAEATIAAGC